MNAILNMSPEHINNKPFRKYTKTSRIVNIGVPAINNNGNLYHDGKTKDELLSHQFRSVFSINDDIDHLPTMSHPKYPIIENIIISIEGVEKLLNDINIHKASGPDKYQILSPKHVHMIYLQHWIAFINKVQIPMTYQMTGKMQI